MAEQFHESDTIFADHRRRRLFHPSLDYAQILVAAHRNNSNSNSNNNTKNKDDFAGSLPVKIPETVFRYNSDTEEVDEEWDSKENMVPPHVIIGRRVAGKMAFSVCTGTGRTLKGRDLSQVRNSILRMTGFLET